MSKRIVFPAVLIIIVLLAAYVGYEYWWKRTPEYSLGQIAKAVETHDLDLFRKHVDLDSVVNRLIDDALSASYTEMEKKPVQGYEGFGRELGKGLIQLFKPRLAEMFKQQIEKFVETGRFEEAPPAQGNQQLAVSLKEFKENVGDKIKGIKYIKKEGKIALIGVEVFNEQVKKTQILELKMREKEGKYWQLAEFSNLAQLMREAQLNQ